MTDKPNYNDGQWHFWNGNGCPVHPRSIVDMTFADGDTYIAAEADRYLWDTPLMFRVKKHKKPREFWACEEDGKFYHAKQSAPDARLFREVIE